MKPNGLGAAMIRMSACLAGAGALAGGCAMQKTGTERVLTGSDFIADPGTMPTQVESSASGLTAAGVGDSPPPPGVRTISGTEASEGIVDAVATAGAPPASTDAAPRGNAVLIDQKVGEINGRPVRVRDIFDEVGQRLETTARTKHLSAREWQFITGKFDAKSEMRTMTRQEWMAYAGLVCAASLNRLLEDELLEAEARASLKPQQKQGLAWLVQEASENLRRENAGSRAAAERNLEEKSGKTEQQWAREHESRLLIGYQLDDRIRRKVRVSWKDVRLFYERNIELFNPPPTAKFRLIRVPASDAAGVAAVQAALDSGEAFDKVAGGAPNTFHPEDGGSLGERTFRGPYAEADFNLPPALQTAARGLTAGTYTQTPVDLKAERAWVYLESVRQISRPLADRDVQLEIARRLTSEAESAERESYINKLKERASFTDLNAMVQTLVEAAGERYWPKG